uniref:Protein MCM10 homolog n=1 Tax=Panagrolaimus superbus TaxID=310955 RepID=A0A914YNH8_9BILA
MTADRIRELVEQSRTIVNSEKSAKLESSSSAFPFSSDRLKASTSSLSQQFNLTDKAAAVGKALAKVNDDNRGEVFDPIFGIRVKNPKITCATLSTYCTGFKKIRPSHLRKTNIPKGEDWVTMGVIVEKSEFRKSANGHEYMIWKISDLTSFQDTPVKVLLFGECVKQHWKLQQSCVIALTTPQIADSTDDKTITLKLTKPAQVIDIGFCPDFGHCKAVTKEGTKCSKYVNTSSTEYCVYHIQKAAKKTLVSRAALGSQYNSPIGCRISKPKMGVRNGENKVVGKTHTFLNAAKVFVKNEEDTKSAIPSKSISKTEFKAIKEQENEKLQAFIAGNKVNFGAKNLIKHRVEKNDIVKNAAAKPSAKPPVDVKAFLREQKLEFDKSQTAKTNNALKFVNLLGSPTNDKKKMTAADINRQRLAEKIKAQGGIDKVDPNQTRKRTATQMLPTKTKENSIFEKKMLHLNIQALLGKKSIHEKVIEEADRTKEDAYFSSMEVQEKIESRLTELSELKDVKVVTCKKCDYTNEKQSSFCMIHGHLVQWHKADKRFFKCSSCKQRITIFEVLPTKPCKT